MKDLDKLNLKVRLRGGFSDRNKIKPENTDIQTISFDERSRIALINALHLAWEITFEHYYIKSEECNNLLIKILSNVYVQEVNYNAEYNQSLIMKTMDNTIKNDDYDIIFSLLEYVCREFKNIISKNNYQERCSIYNIFNKTFEDEYIGYRFIKGDIVPITSKIETEAINEALTTKYESVNRHFEKSLKLLSNRSNPDYENSIKESISGVESMCSELLGEKMGLGDSLKSFEKRGLTIHPALKGAFLKLYGYTSDGDGIRHGNKMGGEKSTFEEAKYMLVSCSAFTNYLKSVEYAQK